MSGLLSALIFLVKGCCPGDVNLLRGVIEKEVRELDAGPLRARAPCLGIESGKPLEDVIDPLARALIGDLIAIFPFDGIGIDEELKALQEPVIAERVRCLLKIGRQLFGLHAAEDRHAKVRNDDRPAPDAIRVVIVGAVPRFEEELPVPFAALTCPRTQSARPAHRAYKAVRQDFRATARRAFRRSDRWS